MILFSGFRLVNAQIISFEKNRELTATYQEMIGFYQLLDKKYDQMRIFDFGQTDIGKPLNLIVLSGDKIFDPVEIRKQNKRVLLINNGME